MRAKLQLLWVALLLAVLIADTSAEVSRLFSEIHERQFLTRTIVFDHVAEKRYLNLDLNLIHLYAREIESCFSIAILSAEGKVGVERPRRRHPRRMRS